MKTISEVRELVGERCQTRVATLRREAGLKLRELSQYSGIPCATISRIERGGSPDIRTAMQLARFFETTVDELFAELLK